MSQAQTTKTTVSQPTNSVPIDPTPLLQSNSPTAIILSIAILLWVLRPVMLQQRSDDSDKFGDSENKPTSFPKRAIAVLVRALKLDSSQ
ncbi:MAG: hypothetical protein KME30_06100 [Iphinoe sp. HA4291-MV1]|jgi:hypothetical protein|nr:hypothetical protein [Iphinoe sp. HA4291-MV1]